GYATLNWHRGRQTLGLRPCRLRVVAADGGAPAWTALWWPFALATLSLAAGGRRFSRASIDRDGLTWPDRAAGTRTPHEPNRPGPGGPLPLRPAARQRQQGRPRPARPRATWAARARTSPPPCTAGSSR